MTDDTKPDAPVRPRAAWDNFAWAVSVMFRPDADAILEHIRAQGPSASMTFYLPVLSDAYSRGNEDALTAGQHAGMVLGLLYALEHAPWQIPRTSAPSLEVAYKVAGALAREHNAYAGRLETAGNWPADGKPRFRYNTGRSFFIDSLNRMRPVAHLWGALWLHEARAIVHPHGPVLFQVTALELLTTKAVMSVLHMTAHALQRWALAVDRSA
jgi:hypothetical protein